MNYTIKNVTTEQELDDTLAFTESIFGDRSGWESAGYSRMLWLERMKTHGDLMLFAESDGKVISIVFGRVRKAEALTVGPVAVKEQYRGYGVAQELMLLLEKRALGHGIHHLGLGSVETAEGFYAKLGYIGWLLIQSENHSIDELLTLNTKYKVKSTNVYGGTINQIYLELTAPDRELQRKYETELPGTYTQMMFWKNI